MGGPERPWPHVHASRSASSPARPDQPLQDSAVCFNVALTNGHRLQTHLYIVYDTDCEEGGGCPPRSPRASRHATRAPALLDDEPPSGAASSSGSAIDDNGLTAHGGSSDSSSGSCGKFAWWAAWGEEGRGWPTVCTVVFTAAAPFTCNVNHTCLCYHLPLLPACQILQFCRAFDELRAAHLSSVQEHGDAPRVLQRLPGMHTAAHPGWCFCRHHGSMMLSCAVLAPLTCLRRCSGHQVAMATLPQHPSLP